MTNSRPKFETIARLALATLLVLVFTGWTTYVYLGETLITSMYEQHSISLFNVDQTVRKSHTVPELLRLTQHALALFSAVVALAIASWSFRHQLSRFLSATTLSAAIRRLRPEALPLSVTIGCSFVCFLSLYRLSYEADWYNISEAMAFTIDPPYRHRILFVLFANLVRLLTQLPVATCFFVSQLLAIILVMHSMRKWAALFVPRDVAVTAQLLLVAMLVPTFSYRTFYDIAIVFFYTMCLWLLFKRRWAAYLLLFTVGTLNHEVALLLVFPATAIAHGSGMARWRLLSFVVLQVVAYAAVRGALFYFLPVSRAWSGGRVWTNLEMVFHFYERPNQLIETAILWVWFSGAFLAIKRAPKDLWRAVVLLPVLLIVIGLFGRINEARLFNPFIPVAIGLILCGIWTQRSELGPQGAREAPQAQPRMG